MGVSGVAASYLSSHLVPRSSERRKCVSYCEINVHSGGAWQIVMLKKGGGCGFTTDSWLY